MVAATSGLVQRSNGRATPEQNLHVTLAFLGDADETEFAALEAVPPLPSAGVELSIDSLAYRRRPRLLWAVPGTVPEALLELERWLWTQLDELGVSRQRRAYRPHVTLARRADGVADGLTAVSWAVREFVLVQSSLGPPHSSYEIVKRWPLRS